MHNPGSLYTIDSEVANRYKRLGQIGGLPAGPGLESVPTPAAAGRCSSQDLTCTGISSSASFTEVLIDVAAGQLPVQRVYISGGGMGVVHKEVLPDGSVVAVKTIR